MRLPAVSGQPLTAEPSRARGASCGGGVPTYSVGHSGAGMTRQELAGTGLNAVDAEQVVEECAEQRQRQTEGDPAERRLRSAFVEQCV